MIAVQSMPSLFSYRATLLRVVDGDTLELECDLGFRTFVRQVFRLVGVNCPEMNTAEGKAARQYTEAWFASDKQCVIQTVRDKREKYGRYLARVLDAQGRCLNADLINNHMGVLYIE